MNIKKLATHYIIRKLAESDLEMIYQLACENELYYKHCPPFVTRDSIRQDMCALPPGKSLDDKYYIGFFDEERLIAIMDLIDGYPDADTAYIGLFMVDQENQNRGVGSQIIGECTSALTAMGFKRIMLGYVNGNPQAEHFWTKNGFYPTGVEDKQENYTVVVMKRIL